MQPKKSRGPNKTVIYECSVCASPFTLRRRPNKDLPLRCAGCIGNDRKRRHTSIYEKYAKGNPKYQAKRRAWQLATNYGMSPDDYERMFIEQSGACKICRRPELRHSNLCIDHDHNTGMIRGLLCHSCNMALGLMADDADRIQMMWVYLDYARHHSVLRRAK